ncbi:MAG: dTMP kinase [Bacteroidales bacterium]|nr:dTMP kinase [Bacteroidales bacterium]
MKFVVIEGLDGSGKSTQVNLVKKYFEDNNISYKYLHFPRTNEPFFGELVAMFLRGDFGSLDQVNPYLVAMIYAGDRKDADILIRKWLDENCLVLVDRYVFSNIAFQCAKLENKNEREKLKNWILELEFKHFGIIKPNLSIFLDVPFEFTKNNLTNQRQGDDRDYLKGKVDIHEANLDFQKTVRDVYLNAVEKEENFFKIECAANGEMLPINEINQKIIQTLIQQGIVR